MGRSHVISGVVAGLAVCDTVAVPGPLVPVVVAVAAYSALAPDLDHPSAPAANVLGPVSWAACFLVRRLSARTTGSVHRGITHSLLYALAWGVLLGGIAAALFPVQVAAWIAVAAAVGCTTHIAGDLWTLSGCDYVLWPSSVQVSLPRAVRFRTGGREPARLVGQQSRPDRRSRLKRIWERNGEKVMVGVLMLGGVALLSSVLS